VLSNTLSVNQKNLQLYGCYYIDRTSTSIILHAEGKKKKNLPRGGVSKHVLLVTLVTR
jgi:hypothetical protein